MRVHLTSFLISFQLYNLHTLALNNAKQFEDSLLHRVNMEQEALKKIGNYIDLIQYYQLNNFVKANQYSDSTYRLAKKANSLEYQFLVLFEKT